MRIEEEREMKAKWITPVVTALDKDGHVDVEGNKSIYDFLIENGMDGILLFGSIGEFFCSTHRRKESADSGGNPPY